MKDEIKEILDYFRKYMSIKDCVKLSKIEDYITNLQEKYEIAQKNIETLTNNYNDLVKMSENKITNLQEELEGYKQERERILNKLDYVKKNKELQEENESLKNQLDFIEEQNHIIDKLEKENERLKKELNTLKLSEEEWLNKTLGGDDNE